MFNNPNTIPNPLTEAALIIISVALIVAMTILFMLGKIDYIEAIPFLTVVAGLWGVNTALKAPSPAQQAQIGAQQQSLQDMLYQLMNVLPALFQAHSHPVPTTPTPVTIVPPQPAPVAQPMPVQQAPVPPSQAVPMQVAQPVQQVSFPPQASSGYVDPLAMPRTAQMPVVTLPQQG